MVITWGSPDDSLQSLRPVVGDPPQVIFFAFTLHWVPIATSPVPSRFQRFSFTLRIHPWDSWNLAPFYGPHQIPTLFTVNLYTFHIIFIYIVTFLLASRHFDIFLCFIFNDSECPAL
jgi:hypothetical protein